MPDNDMTHHRIAQGGAAQGDTAHGGTPESDTPHSGATQGGAARGGTAAIDVGARLRHVRVRRGLTLTALAELTGISKSTLSRLENGQRRPGLDLLVPIARVHRMPLDQLVGAPATGDPRIAFAPRESNGRTVVPLTPHPGSLQAWKVVVPAEQSEPAVRVHEGHEWLYVLSGSLRLVLGDHDIVMRGGETAEFDTRVPHWFGSTGERPVEILSILGRQGERMRVRARPRAKQQG
ncbi:helix-turn-helix domain-containing protein [Paractinoplanes deccanensis]|nr:XRE family transcriptional regulator [Actinoplanes deccanensis]